MDFLEVIDELDRNNSSWFGINSIKEFASNFLHIDQA